MNITIENNKIIAKNTITHKKYVCDIPIKLKKYGLGKLDAKAVITQGILGKHYEYVESDKLQLTFPIVINGNTIEYPMYLDQNFEMNLNVVNNLNNAEKELFFTMKNKIDYLENKIELLESNIDHLQDKINDNREHVDW